MNLVSYIVLEKAKAMDPQRPRTIGVITNPDRVLTYNAREYVRVVKNQESAYKLLLGWHVLRNRGEGEVNAKTRDEIEEPFFKTRAWATIPDHDRGNSNLRIKLGGISFSHIRNSLPGVIKDIKTKLRDRQSDLIRLRDQRSDYGLAVLPTHQLPASANAWPDMGATGDTTIPFLVIQNPTKSAGYGGWIMAQSQFNFRLSTSRTGSSFK